MAFTYEIKKAKTATCGRVKVTGDPIKKADIEELRTAKAQLSVRIRELDHKMEHCTLIREGYDLSESRYVLATFRQKIIDELEVRRKRAFRESYYGRAEEA